LDFKGFCSSGKRGDGTAGARARAGTVVFSLVFSLSCFAQAQRPDAGSVLEGLKQPPSLPKAAPEVLPKVQEPRPALGAPGLKVVVSGFRITGNTLFDEATLLDTVKEFVGKEQTIDGLNDAATKVRAFYRERGYFLAQAYLPQQEIKSGIVEIAVIEARVGKVAVDLKEGTRYSETMVRGIVDSHLKEGDIITETGLETPLLLLNDFPNAVVTSEIKPSQTVGAADLIVHVSDAPAFINGFVDYDNSGNRFIGQHRTGISLNLNNPFALGDQISYRGFISNEDFGFYRLAYVVPVGYWGTRVGVSYATFHYRLGLNAEDATGTVSSLVAQGIHGAGAVTTLYAFHPFVRTRSSNLIAQFAYETKSLSDRNETVGSINDTRITSTKLGLVGDYRDALLGGGLNSFSYTITEGETVLSTAAFASDQAAAGFKTAGKFAKQSVEFRRLQKMTDNTNLLLTFSGQMASKNLPSAEKFSLGGPTGVRAYPTGEALGDTGWLLQAEGRYIVPGWKLLGGDVTVSAFWDQGWVRINENQPAVNAGVANNRRLSGYGIGGSIGKDGDFVLRASAAWRNEDELPQADTAPRTPRVWVQAIKWF
jgi:hemolysin activation/secretion protein